jgi:hypothetical protein
MKRKVRIYKDPNGQGGYINKTAQWLRKAQEGAQTGMTPVTAGIMQQMQSSQPQQMQQQQPEQDPREQMLQAVVQLAQQGYGQDDIKDYILTNVYGLDKNTQEYSQYEPQILDFVSAVFEQNSDQEEEQEVDVQEPISNVVESQGEEQAAIDQGSSDEDLMDEIIYDDYETEDDTEEARYGGVPNKRSYVNKVIRQLKKAQQGGDQVEQANTANVRGTEDNPTTDTPGNTNPFIAGVKGQAENHFFKQQAEQMYNNQFGQGMQQQPQAGMDFAQFGGMRMRRANRAAFGTPFVPPGASAKYKFGLLGGLKNAEVQFNPLMMASMFPMMSFPGMGGFASGYSYMTPKKKYTTGRLVTEKIATAVNNKSTTDVAKATGSEAAKSSEKFDVVVGNPGKKVEFTPGERQIVPEMNSRSIANTFSQPHPELSLQQMGGIISAPQQDQFGGLQKFIYGDEVDDVMLNALNQPINQTDLDYTDSKDTTDAFFRHGGLHRFQGTGDSQTNSSNAGKTYNQEELDKMIAEKQKSWEADYQKKYNQQMQGQQQMMQGYPGGYGAAGYNPNDSYSAWGSRGNYGGFGPMASTGLLGAAGNLIKGFGRGPSTYGPAGNPLQYAATAAAITKSGMLPTGMKYSKEKAEGFLGKLGLKNDRVWTLDYATPDQIKAQAAMGTKPGATPAPGMAGSKAGDDKSKMSLKDRALNAKEKFLNRNTSAEADAEAFTGTLKGSTEPQQPSKSAEQELANFEANQRRQGLTLDPKTQKWVKTSSLINDPNAARTPGMSPSQGADVVAGTPGASVGTLPSQGGVSPTSSAPAGSPSGIAPGTPISGMTESPGMVGKTPEEIREALRTGTSIPTVVNKGNTTYINAAGNPINPADYEDEEGYAYGGYVPSYMAYGGYIPEAQQGINFSTVSYDPNSITKPGGIGQGQTGPCTEAEVKDPNSPCYDPMYAGEGPRLMNQAPQTAQLKIKEEKGKMDPTKLSRGVLDFGANLADAQDYITERRNKYIPGMTEFAMGEKQDAEERINKGEWNARTGKEGIQGFEGVIRKGGSIGKKKSSASGNKINLNDFQDLLKLAGLK